MKKRIVLIALAAVMVFALMGCNVTKTETRTEVVTDANGKTTTTTTTITNENGKITEKTETVEGEPAAEETEAVEEAEAAEEEDDAIVATLAFQNDTGVDLHELYFVPSSSEDWGGNVLGDEPLPTDYTRTYHNRLTYHPDTTVWDLKVADHAGNALELAGIDISEAADPENILIILTYDDTENILSFEVQ